MRVLMIRLALGLAVTLAAAAFAVPAEAQPRQPEPAPRRRAPQADDNEVPPRGPRSLSGIDDPKGAGAAPPRRGREEEAPPDRTTLGAELPRGAGEPAPPEPKRAPVRESSPPAPRETARESEPPPPPPSPRIAEPAPAPPPPPRSSPDITVVETPSERPGARLPTFVPRGAVTGTRAGPRDPTEDLIVRSQRGVTLGAMLDELVDDVAHQLSKEDPKLLGPMAVRLVRLSPNLRPALAATVEAKIVSRLGRLPNFAQVVCIECRAVRSRVDGGDWVVTIGAVTQADLRRIAADIGAKTFMEVDLTFNQAPAELVLAAKIYRATDGHILWTAALKGDETTAAVMRTGKIPPSREEQLKELQRKLEMRPYFGYMAMLGVHYVGSDSPLGGYTGINLGIRLFERFGPDRRHMYGIQGEGVLSFAEQRPLYAGVISAGYWFSILQPNLNRPDLRIGATAGGFIAGTEGNSAMLQVMVEYVLQFRLAINVAGTYMVPVKFAGGAEDIGGFGGAARFAFNW